MSVLDQNTDLYSSEAIERLPVRTYSQIVYAELRRRILDGRLAPGTKVTVRVLSEELGISPTPIKNALAALETEGFLESVAHRGYSVPVIERQTLTEAFEVMEALDVFAAQKIARSENRDIIIAQLEALVDSDDLGAEPQDWSGYELDFHKVMWEGAGNQRLVDVAERQRGIVLVASGGLHETPERRREVREEHRAIIHSLRSGDIEHMSAVCAAHLEESAAVISKASVVR